MADLTEVFIHADESCLGNQFQDRANPGGAGGLVEYWKEGQWERRDYWVSETGTTNNRMALRSAIEALSLLKVPCKVLFVSDSQYLVKGMTEWVRGWKARGWKRKAGPIENLELWKELTREAARHAVGWRWVRGHAKHARNEFVDHLATRAAKEQTQSGGLVPSEFRQWLETEREKRQRYMDFFEDLTPEKTKWGG
jgi:ribonuclease HI